MAFERVRPFKLESPDEGGEETDVFPTTVNPNEDVVDCHGVSFQSVTSDDTKYVISRDKDGAWVKTPNARRRLALPWYEDVPPIKHVAAGDLWHRASDNVLFSYDGARWLSVTAYVYKYWVQNMMHGYLNYASWTPTASEGIFIPHNMVCTDIVASRKTAAEKKYKVGDAITGDILYTFIFPVGAQTAHESLLFNIPSGSRMRVKAGAPDIYDKRVFIAIVCKMVVF